MTQYLSQQSLLCLLAGAFLLGFAVGAVYQLFLIRRAAFVKMQIPRLLSVLWLNLEDFLILVATGFAVTVLFYAVVSGVPRLMAIPALGLGLFCWRITLGRLINGATDRILGLVARLVRRIQVRLFQPVERKIRGIAHGLWKCWTDQITRRRQARMQKQAETQTADYGDWLERVLLTEGRLPDEMNGRTKER